jgi:hypothetical protein
MVKQKSVFSLLFLLFLFFFGLEANSGNSAVGSENGVSGIIFFSTQQLEQLHDFYIDQVGCQLWLDQGACQIFQYGNMLFGFCKGNKVTKEGTITFFFKEREDVDRMYQKFRMIANSPPKENKKYRIYHFYAADPEGRSIEFQYFMHPIDWNFELYTTKK